MRLSSCEKVMGQSTTQCKKLLFHAKTMMKEFDLAHLNKDEEETDFCSLATFWFSTFAKFYVPLGVM